MVDSKGSVKTNLYHIEGVGVCDPSAPYSDESPLILHVWITPQSGSVSRMMLKLAVNFFPPVECEIAAFGITKTWGVSSVCREGMLPQHKCWETSRNPLYM